MENIQYNTCSLCLLPLSCWRILGPSVCECLNNKNWGLFYRHNIPSSNLKNQYLTASNIFGKLFPFYQQKHVGYPRVINKWRIRPSARQLSSDFRRISSLVVCWIVLFRYIRIVSDEIPAVLFDSAGRGERRRRATPPAALFHLHRLMMALSLAWSGAVWRRFTPIIPLGAFWSCTSLQNTVTPSLFYVIAGGVGDNGRATMSFCVTDKCLIWLT